MRVNAIVLLFKKANDDTITEEFENANIENITVMYEENPNVVYSEGLKEGELYNESSGFFRTLDKYTNDNVSAEDFYEGKKYSVVIDLRAVKDNTIYGTGKRLIGTQSGIVLAMTKKVTKTDLKCFVYCFADASVSVKEKDELEINFKYVIFCLHI